MKLLMPQSRLWEFGGGNVKTQTALGDALFFWSSDRGSTPLGSTLKEDVICQMASSFVILSFRRKSFAANQNYAY